MYQKNAATVKLFALQNKCIKYYDNELNSVIYIPFCIKQLFFM